MKILFLIPSLGGGGQEKAGMILTNYLGKFHEVLVVSLEPKAAGEFDYKSEIKRIEIDRANNKIGKTVVAIKRIFALKKIKKQFRPDVTIAFGPTAMIINSLGFGRDKKISSIRQSLSKLPSNKTLDKWLYTISGSLVPVHNEINTELFHLHKIKNDLFAYNGYDLDKIRSDAAMPIEADLELFFKNPVVSHLGRFDIPKCNWQLVKSFHLAKKIMPSLQLLMIGGVDESNPANRGILQFCIHYCEQQGYKVCKPGEPFSPGCDVLMLGHQANPHKYLSRASLFVFPSAWEGFPNALVEAMACGLPVISADCPTGPKEILQPENNHEQYGILLPVFDHHFSPHDLSTNPIHQLWADAIVHMAADPQKMLFYKEQSLKRVLDFSVEKSGRRWLDIIEGRIMTLNQLLTNLRQWYGSN